MAIEILKFKPYVKNTLQGFFSCRLTNIGIEIQGCSLHDKNGKRWVGLPTRPYQDENGDQKWNRIIDFFDKKKGKQFQKATLEAIDRYNDSKQA